MTNVSVIENKISAAKKYLGIVRRYRKYSRAELESNTDIRGAAERYLYLAAQSAIDVAEAFIAYKNFRKPTTMTETFYILNEERILTNVLTKKLAGMVGFRNIIAHDYGKINYDIVYKVLHRDIHDITIFLARIAASLTPKKRRPSRKK